MENDPARRLESVLSRRKDFAQLVLVAAIMAFGVSLLAGALLDSKLMRLRSLEALAFMAVLVALGWILLVTFGSREFSTDIDACFIFDPEARKILRIPEYLFSEELRSTIEATLVENAAFARIWRDDPLVRGHDQGPKSTPNNADPEEGSRDQGKSRMEGPLYVSRLDVDAQDEDPKAAVLLREAIEYVLLNRLSVHLADYFGQFPEEGLPIRKYERKDIPSLLLENRVLSLLSKPIEERELFAAAFEDQNPQERGAIYTIHTDCGAIYERFELRLPAGTAIQRPTTGTIVLENSRITLTITTKYTGFNEAVPFDFMEDYVGADPTKVEVKSVGIRLKYEVKPLSLLRKSGWEYFQWVDSFAATVNAEMSVSRFLRRIGWDTISAALRVLARRRATDSGKSA